ncbi:hypothetical protein Dip518_000762 [Parelusimicrobium proximum]|uniref:hypothetical protein n=1 Tax=Parelusimicrobium proximum TaxID=3228953 RepID=UPI003D16D256
MKYTTAVLAVIFIALCTGCSSGSKNSDMPVNVMLQSTITDQEFAETGVLAPAIEYSKETPYQRQLQTSGTYIKGTKGSK